MNFNVTEVYEKNEQSTARIVINRGGTRSSKTYSIIQLLIIKALTEPQKRIIVCRKSLPSLKRTVLQDFLGILDTYNLTRHFKKNLSNLKWSSKNGSSIEFISLDNDQKIRGLQANYFYYNESSEIEEIFVTQALLRLSNPSKDNKLNQFFIDFNPSSSSSYLKKMETRENVEVIVSTFEHNPFLSDEVVKEIKDLEFRDYDLFLIYGKGEYGDLRGQVFRNWNTFNYKVPPEIIKTLPVYYGLDWGYTNDYTCCVECYIDKENKQLYVFEKLFSKGLTNPDIDRVLTTRLEKTVHIVADSSEPKSIDEMKHLGWRNIVGVVKGPDSIKNGIDIMLRYNINIASNALNIIDEFTNYTWKTDKQGTPLNVPNDKYNHCFVGDTLITTNKGDIKIKDVKKGDYVLTSQGFKEVEKSWCSGEKEVFEYILDFDAKKYYITCTNNHNFKINNVWKEIQEAKVGDKFLINKNLMVKNTHYSMVRNILGGVQNIYTELFGNSLMEKLKKGFISTIKMGINSITKLKTLKKYQKINIYQHTLKNMLKKIRKKLLIILTKLDPSQKSGIRLKKELSGIESTANKWALVLGNMMKESVKYVIKYINQIHHINYFAQTTVNQNTEDCQGLIISKSNVQNVEKNLLKTNMEDKYVAQENVLTNINCESKGVQKIYDLQVKDCHEFFANNILVHNSIDGIRYICTTFGNIRGAGKIYVR